MRTKLLAAAVAAALFVPAIGSAATINDPSTLNITYAFTYSPAGMLTSDSDLTAADPVTVVEHTGSFAGATAGTVSNLIGDSYPNLDPTGTDFNYTNDGGEVFTISFDDFDLIDFTGGSTQSYNAQGSFTLSSPDFDTVSGVYSMAGTHSGDALKGSITLSTIARPSAVPLPASLSLLLAALAGLGYVSRRRTAAV